MIEQGRLGSPEDLGARVLRNRVVGHGGLLQLTHVRADAPPPLQMSYLRPTLLHVLGGTGRVEIRHLQWVRNKPLRAGQLGVFPAGFSHNCVPGAGSEFVEFSFAEDALSRFAADNEMLVTGGAGLVPAIGIDDPLTASLSNTLLIAVAQQDDQPLITDRLVELLLARFLGLGIGHAVQATGSAPQTATVVSRVMV